jgi:hypothetical protein
MKQEKIISRRTFLKGSAGVVGAGALAAGFGAGSLIKPSTAHASAISLPLPLPGALLDPDEVAQLAFTHYRAGAGEG